MNISFSGNKLISGGEDGLVNIWDLREKHVSIKIEPHQKSQLTRPNIGNWIGAVAMNEDWLVCIINIQSYLKVLNFLFISYVEVDHDYLFGT